MAYVANDVYANGILNEILKEDGKVYIALTNGDKGDKTDEVFLKSVLAVSELRSGNGEKNDTTELTNENINNAETNNVGSFSNKTLNLLSVSYNRTKSVEGDIDNFSYCNVNDESEGTTASREATHFAIIKYEGMEADLTAYQVDDSIGGSTHSIIFKGPTISSSNITKHKVLIVGDLTSNPTINEDSNFMFGGARITFSEA